MISQFARIDKALVAEAIIKSSTIKEVLENLGLKNSGWAYSRLKQYCNLNNLILPERDRSSTSGENPKRLSDSAVFVQNGNANRREIKKRMIKRGISYECVSCGNNGFWNGKPISLQLEHINGINNDNRIENLCFMCPNCHSQTDTFAGRNTKRTAKINNCLECKREISKSAKKCVKCSNKNKVINGKIRGIVYPEIQVLIDMIQKEGYRKTGRKLKVSDNAIRKHLAKHGIDSKTIKYSKSILNLSD